MLLQLVVATLAGHVIGHDLSTLCDLAVASPAYPDAAVVESAHEVCVEVAWAAVGGGVDPSVAVGVAYHETRLRWLRGAGGEIGPLQIKPRYWCPDGKEEGCDALQAGVYALRYHLDRQPTLSSALAAYNGGPKRHAYAGRAAGRIERFKRWARRQAHGLPMYAMVARRTR